MNRNYRLLALADKSNWIETDDEMIFLQLLHGVRFEHEYPHSILDAMRVLADELHVANLLREFEQNCDRWRIVVAKENWRNVAEIAERLFHERDFGSRIPIVMLDELDWEYNPAKPARFEKDADYVDEAEKIAADWSDWTGFKVNYRSTSVDKGYWWVELPTDVERSQFANAHKEYFNARKRIEDNVMNGVLLLNRQQYEKAKHKLDGVVKCVRFLEGAVALLLSSDATTREIIEILDAAGE